MTALPHGNGIYSKWRPAPPAIWMKPGMLPEINSRRVGQPYANLHQENVNHVPPDPDVDGAFRYHAVPNPGSPSSQHSPYAEPEDYLEQLAPWGGAAYAHRPRAWEEAAYDQHWNEAAYMGLPSGSGSGYGTGMRPNGSTRSPATSIGGGELFPVSSQLNSSYWKPADAYYCSLTNMGYTGYGSTLRWRVSQNTASLGYVEANGFINTALIVPTHSYVFSCWVRTGQGEPYVDVRFVIGGIVSESVDLTNDWQRLRVTVPGSTLGDWFTVGPPYAYIPGGTTLPRSWEISGISVLDSYQQEPAVILTNQPRVAAVAVRSDSVATSQECFPVLFWNYGCFGGGGTGNTDHMYGAFRDRTTAGYDCTGYSTGVSKTWNCYDRSLGGSPDPRELSRPFGSSFYYNRWMDVHPFCPGLGWYWTFKANMGASVGYGYYDWTQLTDLEDWESVLPFDIDPDRFLGPDAKQYTYIQKEFPNSTPVSWDGGWWRSLEFRDEPATIVDSYFTIEVAESWVSYGNSGGPAGCYNFDPPPPIPPAKFGLWVVDWNDHDLIWNGTTGIAGTKIMDIFPNWTGVQNGSWTLVSVEFSGGCHSRGTWNAQTHLGTASSDRVWSAILDITPQDFPSGRVAFYLVEEWAASLTQPWFITHWSVYDSGGPISGGFGSTSDTTGNHYSNSLSVAIQPFLKVQLPGYRYGIPYGVGAESEFVPDPPLRMEQRDDGSGIVAGHSRLRYSAEPKYSSTESPRLFGDNAYR